MKIILRIRIYYYKIYFFLPPYFNIFLRSFQKESSFIDNEEIKNDGNDEGEEKLIRDETGELKYNKCFDGKK